MQTTLDFGKGRPLPPADDDLDKAVTRLMPLLQTHPICIAWSSAKDSSCVLLLVLIAVMRLRQEDLSPVAPIFVMHGDTEVESPAVASLAADYMASLQAWCERVGIDLRFVISRPALAATFAVKVLSGGALPTWPTARSRACTVDWKIAPAKISGRRIAAALQEISTGTGVAFKPVVTEPGAQTPGFSHRVSASCFSGRRYLSGYGCARLFLQSCNMPRIARVRDASQ